MKKGLLFMAMLAIISCKDKDANVEPTLDLTPKEVVNTDEEEVVDDVKTRFPKEEKMQIDILVPGYYERESYESYIAKMNKNWLSFDANNGLFKVIPAQYTLIDTVNECTEMDVIGVFSPEEREPMFFMSPSTLIKKGIKEALSIPAAPLWPGSPQDFLFNGTKYTLRAEGKEKASYDYTEDGGTVRKFKAFSNYKLYIVVGDEEQLLLDIPSFNDTFVKLLFVGDLDGDGKLDFIFDASADYEVETVEVYLSNGAKHILYLAGEVSRDFSC